MLTKVAIWLVGAVTTFVLAVATSKIKVYHDARNKHHEELKQKVLEALRNSLQSHYDVPQIFIKWGQMDYDPNTSFEEVPVKSGQTLVVAHPEQVAVEEALGEDARQNHYQSLMFSWEEFTSFWSSHIDSRVAWIKAMSNQILTESGLPAWNNERKTYVMNLDLGLFLYARLLGKGLASLAVEEQHDRTFVLSANHLQSVAKGSKEEMKHVLQLLEQMRQTQAPRAKELQEEFENLQATRAALSREFSLAIASKKLTGRCPLVNFL